MRNAGRFALPAAYLAICLIWGSTYLAIKVGLTSFDPYFYAGARYLLALLVMGVVVRWLRVPFPGPLRRWLPAFGVGVLFIGVCNGMVFWAETRLDSGFTALLVSSTPLWTALLTPLLPGERRLGGRGWAGIVLGLAGAVLLLRPWNIGSVELLAAIMVELSVVIWAATTLWVRRIRDDFHPFALVVAQMAGGATILFVVAVVRGRAMVGPLTLTSVAALAYLVVFGSCIAFGAYFFLLKHWDASRVATATYINPVVAVALGAVILSEPVTWEMIAGAVVTLAGVALVLAEQRDPRRSC